MSIDLSVLPDEPRAKKSIAPYLSNTPRIDLSSLPNQKESSFSRYGKGVVGGLLSVPEGIGRGMEAFIPAPFPGKYIGKAVANIAKKARTSLEPEDPKFADMVASGFGSMAGFVVPGVGVAKGIAAAKLAPPLARALGAKVSSVLESLTEAGSTYDRAKEKNMDEGQATLAAAKTFLLNLPITFFTNKAGIFGEKGGAIRKGLTSAPIEAFQEATQAGASNLAVGDPFTQGMLESAGVGAIVGGATGGVVGGIENLGTKKPGIDLSQLPDQKKAGVTLKEPIPEPVPTVAPAMSIVEPISEKTGMFPRGKGLEGTRLEGLTNAAKGLGARIDLSKIPDKSLIAAEAVKQVSKPVEIDLSKTPLATTTSNTVEYSNKIIKRQDLKDNPNTIYLFGDNLVQRGYGGQAREMRGEPNAVGIPTKKLPTMSPNAFFTDTEFDKNKESIDTAFSRIPPGKHVIIPSLGTGLADLPNKAPRTYAYLQEKIKKLSSTPAAQSSKGLIPIESAEAASVGQPGYPIKLSTEVSGLLSKYAKYFGERYTPRGAAGVHFRKTGNIFVNALNDIFTVAHEIVHSIEKHQNIVKSITVPIGFAKNNNPIYDPETFPLRKEFTKVYTQYYPGGRKNHSLSVRINEGFSVFLTNAIGWPTRTKEEFPELWKAFIEPSGKYFSPVIKEFLQDGRLIIDKYQALSPTEKIASRVTTQKKEVTETFLNVREKAIEEGFNDIYFLDKLSKESGVQFTGEDVSLYAYMYNNLYKVAQHNFGEIGWLAGGMKQENTYVTMDEKGEYKEVLPFGIGSIFEKVEDPVEFGVWLVARREALAYKKLDGLKKEAEFAREAIKNLRTDLEEGAINKTEYKKNLEELKNIVSKYERLRSVLEKDNFDRKTAEAAYGEHQEKYQEAASMFDAIIKARLVMMHNPIVQLIDDKAFEELSSVEGYASFERDFMNEVLGEEFSSRKPLRVGKTRIAATLGRTGSQLDIINPLYTLITSEQEILKKVTRQVIYNRLLAMSETFPELAQELPLERAFNPDTKVTFYPQEKDQNIVMARRNYKRVPILFNKELKMLLDYILTPQTVGIVEKVFRYGAKWFIQGTTGWYPPFAAVNFAMDQISAAFNSSTNYIPLTDPINELRKVLINNDSPEAKFLKEYLMLGGERQTFISLQTLDPEKDFRYMTQELNAVESFVKNANNFFDILAFPVKSTELLTRAIEYIKARKEGYHQLAALELAGRVSVPFHHRGRLGGDNVLRGWVRSIPYFGAGLQILAQSGRTLKNPKIRARAIMLISVLTTASAAGLIGVIAAGTDRQKELYKGLSPEELSRYIFLPHFNGKDLIRYRMPDELLLPATMFNMVIAHYFLDASYSPQEFVRGATAFLPDQINPSDATRMFTTWIPQLVSPTVGLVFNKRTYPKVADLEPYFFKYIKPSERKFENTSKFAIWLGGKFNLSPIKIDYLINGQFGRATRFLTGGKIDDPFVRKLYFTSGRNLQFFYAEREHIASQYSDAVKHPELYTDAENKLIFQNHQSIVAVDKLIGLYRQQPEDSPQKEELRRSILDGIDTYRKNVNAKTPMTPEQERRQAFNLYKATVSGTNDPRERLRALRKLKNDVSGKTERNRLKRRAIYATD